MGITWKETKPCISDTRGGKFGDEEEVFEDEEVDEARRPGPVSVPGVHGRCREVKPFTSSYKTKALIVSSRPIHGWIGWVDMDAVYACCVGIRPHSGVDVFMGRWLAASGMINVFFVALWRTLCCGLRFADEEDEEAVGNDRCDRNEVQDVVPGLVTIITAHGRALRSITRRCAQIT